jgi:hypothetical protein
MSASNPEVTFTPRASGDGTWYVEVASPAIACEEVGDFRSKASAEAWILDILRTYAMSGTSGSGACSANAKTVHGDAIQRISCVPGEATPGNVDPAYR